MASNNMKQQFLEALSTGAIGVPACVWQEFQEIFEEEAAEIESYIARKIRMKKAYYVGAASIADKANSRLSQSPYDSNSDLYSAAICSIEQYTLLTTDVQAAMYDNLNCCQAVDLEAWINSQEDG